MGACGVSLQRPYGVTSAVPQEVWQSLDSVFCLYPAEGSTGKGHVRESGPGPWERTQASWPGARGQDVPGALAADVPIMLASLWVRL